VKQAAHHNTNDERWLVEAAKTNMEHFEPLYNRYYDEIFRFIFRRTDDEYLTADLCSQTFFKALSNLKKFTWTGTPFRAWLFTIAANEVRKYYRDKRKVFVIEESRMKGIAEDDSEINRLDMYDIVHIFENLDDKEVRLIEMKYFENYTFAEMADYFNEKESAMKMRVYRLLKKVRKLIIQADDKI
jgi:RNA polymerase sigma-70 factor (ECF subfamily)